MFESWAWSCYIEDLLPKKNSNLKNQNIFRNFWELAFLAIMFHIIPAFIIKMNDLVLEKNLIREMRSKDFVQRQAST